ncbi:Superoxide dismutase [Cu-Zn] [Terramyces sp. JEL0728]|nr:Superoxide dismutase [Cu-Zn] [Terramyces sp. JEL0728]
MESQEKKEQRLLKQKVEVLERENYALKKSLYELSTRYNSMKLPPFALGELLHSLDNVDTLFETKEELGLKKQFYHKQELKGHQGAVYQVQYSNCGRWISSGSFDRTVRIWDPAQSKELHCLTGHALNISDLSWSDCSTELLSGGYDQTCKTWNVEQGKLLESFDSDGFVQCVQFNPQNKNIFFSGSSRNILAITDRRQPSAAIGLRNDSMVNTMYIFVDLRSVFQNGLYVISGDANGYIKVWDVRTATMFSTKVSEEIFAKAEIPTENRDPVFELEKQDVSHVLATGSADPFIYVFLVGQTELEFNNPMLAASLLFAAALVNAKTAQVQLKPDSTGPLGANVTGTITLEQPDKDTKIKITLDIAGLAPSSTHGWHVHNLAVPASQNCTAAGPHFNPMNKTHGAPEDEIRHFGDLGNFVTDANGKASITVTDRLLSLFGDAPVNALNRGFVIHQNADDLGKGNTTASLTTGNAGGRLACGNIAELTSNTTTAAGYTTSIPVTQGYATTTQGAYPSKPTTTGYGTINGAAAAGSAAMFLSLAVFML